MCDRIWSPKGPSPTPFCLRVYVYFLFFLAPLLDGSWGTSVIDFCCAFYSRQFNFSQNMGFRAHCCREVPPRKERHMAGVACFLFCFYFPALEYEEADASSWPRGAQVKQRNMHCRNILMEHHKHAAAAPVLPPPAWPSSAKNLKHFFISDTRARASSIVGDGSRIEWRTPLKRSRDTPLTNRIHLFSSSDGPRNHRCLSNRGV